MSARTWLGAGVLVVLLGWAGCAKGTSAIDGGGVGGGGGEDPTTTSNGPGSTTSTTGGGGDGSTTTATSTSTTTTTSTTTSTSSGNNCSEQPCKLTAPQCGCAAGEACTIGAGNDRVCAAAGNAGWGSQCTAQNNCQPGLLCVQTSASVSTCSRFCTTDAECQAPGGICIRTLNDGNGGAIPDATLCTENCDPALNTGCPAPGTACQIGREQDGAMRFFTTCAGSGAATQGASCATVDDCAPGYSCFNTDPNDPNAAVCLRWCDQNAPSCPGGTSCVGVTIDGVDIVVGNKLYGACY